MEMTKDEYLKLADETLAEVLMLVTKKNNDYTAGTADPFNNFRLATMEGVTPETGLMIRVQDKMQRIRTYINSGSLLVTGEGYEDAIHDIIGYMLILKGLLVEKEAIMGFQRKEDPVKVMYHTPYSKR